MPFLLAILFFGILTLWVPARWALTGFQVALLALAMVRVVTRLRDGRGLPWHPVALLLAGGAAWGLLQLAAGSTVDAFETQEAVLNWVVNLVAFSLALEFTGDGRGRRGFLLATLAFAGVLALLSIFTLLTSSAGTVFWWFPVDADQPLLGPFLYRNQYASFAEAVLPIALVEATRNSRWGLYVLIAAIIFGSVIASGSRAGTALCLAEIVAVPSIACAQGLIRRRFLVPALLGGLLIVLASTAVVGSGVIQQRFREPQPYRIRGELVRSSVLMIRDRPWAGFGLGAWSAAYPAYASYDDGSFVNQAHNDWVQWAAEGGLPFLGLMLAIAGWSIIPAVRTLWGIGILSVWLHALLDYPMQQRPALAVFFFALLGLLSGKEKKADPS